MKNHNLQTIELKGERFVLLPEEDYLQLITSVEEGPTLPEPDADGNRPALATVRALIAHDIIRDRKAAGLTQTELAKQAGIRQETLSRIESGKHTPSEKTIKKIDAALSRSAQA